MKLRDIVAERTSPIVAWVGSGLSSPAGIPVWATLKQDLTDALRRKCDSYTSAQKSAGLARVAAIEKQSNPWIAFGMLKRDLGSTSYRDTIREAMRPADIAESPAAYKYLWRLRIRGLMNLNIDRLATKAFVETNNRTPLEFTGVQGTRLGYLLKEPRPFIINLHGHADDVNTWVFTKGELDTLRKNEGYRDFVRTVLYANVVLLLGISADDLAVGGHLESLRKLRQDAGTHFWVTSRTDAQTDAWAERVGIRVIRYDATDGHGALEEMFQDLLAFVPPEDPPVEEPVVSQAAVKVQVKDVPAPAELAKLDAEEIRRILNRHVGLLLSSGPRAADEYAEFARVYDEPIYRAWYVRPNGTLLGYTLEGPIAKGAFGTVYRAKDSNGSPLAIKILLEEIRSNSDLIQSFRRGVRSMRILCDHKLPGVVAYRDSSEIPAFVVMDWIDGPTLKEAVSSRGLESWSILLRCASELTCTLRRAHELPERVLHRDLRPSNVMLPGFYTKDNWQVVVLDFDLSWHRGASETSVVHGATMFGYLAPEQIAKRIGVSTRHSAVDSFGLGMLLFFMASGRDPIPAEHRHSDWQSTVQAACERLPREEWQSLPARYARLVLSATQDQQSRRWDIAQIDTELTRLREAAAEPEHVVAPDFLAEEVAARTLVLKQYHWNEDTTSATAELPTGLKVCLRADSTARKLSLQIGWHNTGVHGTRKVGKFLFPAAAQSSKLLKADGWTARYDTEQQALRIDASISADFGTTEIPQLAATIDRAIEPLRRI